MTESESAMPATCRERLDKYLDAIELALLQTTASRESRRSVVEMVEGQVIEMCRAEISAEATEEDIAKLFDKLDPPGMYAEAFEPTVEREVPRQRRLLFPFHRFPFNHLAIASVGLLILPVPLGLIGATLNSELLIFLFAVSLIGALVVAPVLSVIAIRQIERMKQKGRQLALISLYAAPIVVTNLICFLAPAVLDDVAIIICVLVTVITFNLGVIWSVRYALDHFLPRRSSKDGPANSMPIGQNSVANP